MNNPAMFKPINDYLPKEIIAKILRCLPVKLLIILSTVCKLWYSLITSPSFIAEHLHDSISNSDGKNEIASPYALLIPRESHNYGKTICRILYDKFGFEHEVFDFPIYSNFEMMMIGNSCNGLICLLDILSGRKVYLFNPAIRKLKPLPCSYDAATLYQRGKVLSRLGFGFCENSSDFKVVRILYMRDQDNRLLGNFLPKVEVYSLSNDTWRMVAARVRYLVDRRSVTSNGDIYWLANRSEGKLYDSIMSFDAANEVFQVIGLSANIEKQTIGLLIFKGLLALFTSEVINNNVCYNIWVMNEKGVTESWTKQFSFFAIDKDVRALGFTKAGELVISMLDGRLVELYNPVNQRTKDFLPYGSMYNVDTAFKESLVLLEGAEKIVKVDELARIKMGLGLPMNLYFRSDAYRIQIHGQNVKVRLVISPGSVNHIIAKLKRRTWRRPSAAGIMIKPGPEPSVPDEASLLLVAVEGYCLVFRLQYLDRIPRPLEQFLARRDVCFVGINVLRLREVFYDRFMLMNNSIELSEFVYTVGKSKLCKPGGAPPLANLAAKAGVTIDDPPPEITDIDWNATVFSEDKIRYAVHDVYASYMIGEKMLRSAITVDPMDHIS